MAKVKKVSKRLSKDRHDNQFQSIINFIRKGGQVNMRFAKETFRSAMGEAGQKAHKSTVAKMSIRDYILKESGKINREIGHNEILRIMNEVFLEEVEWSEQHGEKLMELGKEVEKRTKDLQERIKNE